MELRDQLEFCRKCTRREETAGVLACSLTHNRPDFENICENFIKDPMEPENPLDDGFVLKFNEIRDKLESTIFHKISLDQQFPMAIIFGTVASIIGAILWAVISVSTGYQIGYMAVGVGFLVGYTIKFFGKGFELKYSLLGAAASLFGCLLGNLLSIIGFVASEYQLGYWQIISHLDLSVTGQVMFETFQPVDLLFYGIAVYEGFRFSALRFTEKSLWLYTAKYR